MQLRTESKISEVAPTKWNFLSDSGFPFSNHSFLLSLEDTLCVGGQSGWNPCHLTLWEEQILTGAVCLYEKNHGYGEYIFDWGWAKAYEQYGLNYYPKLVSAIPFTPATGSKLLIHPNAEIDNIREKLLEGCLSVMRLSLIHISEPTRPY